MSSDNPEACGLSGEFKSCCCNCRYHLRDYHHCATKEGSALRMAFGNDNGCVCSVARGWVCAGFVLSGEDPTAGVHSGWGEHGLCEMHHPK